jgi:DNA anti-recombination protein RmuC
MTTLTELYATASAIEQRIRENSQMTAQERDTILAAMDKEAQALTEGVLELLKAYQVRLGELRAELQKSFDAQIRAAEDAIGAPAQPVPQIALAAE